MDTTNKNKSHGLTVKKGEVSEISTSGQTTILRKKGTIEYIDKVFGSLDSGSNLWFRENPKMGKKDHTIDVEVVSKPTVVTHKGSDYWSVEVRKISA